MTTELLINKNRFWESLIQSSDNIEKQIDPQIRRHTGAYFTNLELTDYMMSELVQEILSSKQNISELTFLEPCVGTGNFVYSYLKEISKLELSSSEIYNVINNMYFADINELSITEFKKNFKEFVKIYFDIDLESNYFEKRIAKGLLINVLSEELSYIPIEDALPSSIVKRGFDIVVTNPPYKNLKAERKHYITKEDYDAAKIKYSEVVSVIKNQLRYSTTGTLNLYKLFVEEIVDKYTNENGFISLLIPSSILTDKSCTKLRSYLLLNNKVSSIKVIDEGSGYVNAQQALTTMLIQKDKKTTSVKVTKDFYNNPDQETKIYIQDIINDSTGNAIYAVNENEYYILKQLRTFPTLKDLDFIINQRGELDLTINKSSIVPHDTGYPLLRGRNVGYYELVNQNNKEFVLEDFVQTTKKSDYIKKQRIICQQVVNMKKDRRVAFTLVEPNKVLGNSCNFITVLDNKYGIDIYSLLGLFNTSIINWYFKLTSSNNHINNYEIDTFPIPIESKEILLEIGKKAKEYLNTRNELILEEIEMLSFQAYGIDLLAGKNKETVSDKELFKTYYLALKNIFPELKYDEACSILEGNSSIDTLFNTVLGKLNQKIALGITEKFTKIKNNEVLNHTDFKLSELDLEMIRPVPQGGNWKNIPIETVNKSKRLKRITETGGRTTLYGRIDYDKPSYTITTYFNRPGNGTYVHPIHERVLSVREAARFQGFKDDYYIHGNKAQTLKQIGNAVPPILAYQLAKKIKEKINCQNSIDLFSGAGGLTAGFKEAGINSVLANDIEESACITLKINNPETEIFPGDITKNETKEYIIKKGIDNNVDLICGGPPCQGFSTAGLRLADDPRNQLFKDFIDVVEKLKPKVVVFENVPGLLNYQGGKVYRAILEHFNDIGYVTEGKTLMASDFAVPQKRKRVFIMCVRKDLKIMPSELFPEPVTEREELQITAKDTILDLENVRCENNAKYEETSEESLIVQTFKGKVTFEQYLNEIKNRNIADAELFYTEDDMQLSLNL